MTAGVGGLCLQNAKDISPVTVTDSGRLIVQSSTVTGPVTTNASTVSLRASTVRGPATVTGSTANVSIGDTTHGCGADTIAGALSIASTQGQVVVDRAQVTGALSVTGSAGPVASVLAGVKVHGPLSCSGNVVTPTDSRVADAVDGRSSGRCATLG